MTSVPFGFTVGSKWYATCGVCGQIVRVNKPIIGSMHACLTEEEVLAKREWQRMQPPTPYPTEPDLVRKTVGGE